MRKFVTLIGVSALMLFAAAPAMAEPTVRLCAGASDGNYFAAGREIARMSGKSLTIQVVETEGTIDNLDRTLNVEASSSQACDALIGQPDGPVYIARRSPGAAKALRQVGELHREYLHVLCSKVSGVDDLGDLSGNSKYSLAVGKEGSGAWLIWQNILAEDDSYSKVPISTEGGIVALSAVASDITSCMLVPAGLGSGVMATANTSYPASLSLVPANDKDFNDAQDIRGKPLYQYVDIPGGTYKKLQSGFFGSGVATISWRAGVYVHSDRLKDPKVLSAFIQAVARATPSITAEFGQ